MECTLLFWCSFFVHIRKNIALISYILFSIMFSILFAMISFIFFQFLHCGLQKVFANFLKCPQYRHILLLGDLTAYYYIQNNYHFHQHASSYRGARWLSGRVSDSGARGPGFETYRRCVVSLSKTLYSPKVLVNYPGSDGSVPTWLKNCWPGR